MVAEFLSGKNQTVIQHHCKIYDESGNEKVNSWEERAAMNLLLCPEDGTIADVIKRALEYSSLN